MSGRPATSLHQSLRRARLRLALISVLGWGVLIAVSIAEHSRDGQWGPARLIASSHT